MPRHERVISKSGYYHIMLRGNERRNIFLDDEDKNRFIETIKEKKKEDRFYLQAICLMDNHIHMMISEGTENISQVVKRITVSYVHYFNKKYKRVGHLFQDRYKSEAVEEDDYVLALARYIHQNPVKAGIVERVEDYKWSSYNGYINKNAYISKMIDTEMILGLFSEDEKEAVKKLREYTNKSYNEPFMDLPEEKSDDEGKEKELYQAMLAESDNIDEIIREFRKRTGLSIRKIAEITGLNKDKINRIIRI